MATKHYNTGREQGFLIADKLLKEQQTQFENHVTEMKQGFLSKTEVQDFLKQNINNFFELAFKDLERLKGGESPKEIRQVEARKIGDQKTITEGKISAIRDSYDLFLAIQPEDIMIPLPKDTKSWNKKKIEGAQMSLLKEVRYIVSKELEIIGRAQQKQTKPSPTQDNQGNPNADNTQPSSNGSTSEEFREVAIPAASGNTNLDLKALKKFEKKTLVDKSKLKTQEEKDYNLTLNNIFTSYEAYKSSFKKQTFADVLPRGAGSVHSSFCRNQAYETLDLVRESLVALMKGADIKTLCKGKGHAKDLTGQTKAISDVLTLLSSIKPEHLPIDHSAGYKLTYGEQTTTNLAHKTAGRTINHLTILAQTLAREPNPAILFNASTILTAIQTRRVFPPKVDSAEPPSPEKPPSPK